MTGFIVGHGRSGTTWAAYALRECCGLDARHESMKYEVGEGYGGVESNGNLWRLVPEIRRQFPSAGVVLLARDGRLVLRSVLSNKPQRTMERACTTWVARNQKLMLEIPPEDRYRLEDLVTDSAAFRDFATKLGATEVDLEAWNTVRTSPQNQTTHTAPAFEGWPDRDQEVFWRMCGPTMRALGYDDQ